MKDFMVDLETLDNKPTAVIVSVGIVAFDWEEGTIGDALYVVFSPEAQRDQTKIGRTIGADTVHWWMKQSVIARSVFEHASTGKRCLEGLHAIYDFFQNVQPNKDDRRVWGNGANFDNVILRDAFEREGMNVPWHFWNDRCFRTLKNIDPVYAKIKNTADDAHTALSDALFQARQAIRILRVLNGKET